MNLGTHVHYTKTSKSSYSAKPDYAWGGCGGHFPKWPLSHKLRGAEPSISTLYNFLWGVDFRKSIAKCTRPFYPTLWTPFYKMAAISKVLRSISVTKRRRAFNVDSMHRFCGAKISEKVLPNVSHHSIRHCERRFTKWRPFPKYYSQSQKLRGAERSMLTLCIGFVGRRFQKKYCQIHHHIVSAILEAIFQKNGGLFQSNTSYLWKHETDNRHSGVYHFSGILFRLHIATYITQWRAQFIWLLWQFVINNTWYNGC